SIVRTMRITDRPPGTRDGRARRRRPSRAARACFIRHQVNHAVGHESVAGIVRNWKVLELAQAGFHIRGADFGGVLASLIQHLIRHVDYDHGTGVADLRGCQKAVEARTAARSITTSPGFRAAIAWGLPQPSLRLAPSGTAASSASA